MKLDRALIGKGFEFVQSEIQTVNLAFKEKGVKHFARPLLLGLVMVYASHALIYKPLSNRLAGLNRRIATAKAVFQYADQYKKLRDRLVSVYALLPPLKDKDSWLTATTLELMKAEGIVSNTIVPPQQQEEEGLALQTITVPVDLKFSELVSWLGRIESHKPLLHVSSIEIAKGARGRNKIVCSLSTLVPIQRLAQ